MCLIWCLQLMVLCLEGCVTLNKWNPDGRGGPLGEELEVLCLTPLAVHFLVPDCFDVNSQSWEFYNHTFPTMVDCIHPEL